MMDTIQTAGIIVIAAMLVYVVVRLDRSLTAAAAEIKTAIVEQQGIRTAIERIWRQFDLFIPAAELKPLLDDIRSRLDRLEANGDDQ